MATAVQRSASPPSTEFPLSPSSSRTSQRDALPDMHLSDLKNLHVSELVEMAITNEVENANRLRKQDLIFALLKNRAKKGDSIFGSGTLEVLPDGFGFLRSPDTSYLAGPDRQCVKFVIVFKIRHALIYPVVGIAVQSSIVELQYALVIYMNARNTNQ